MKSFLRTSRFSRHTLHKLGLGHRAKAGHLAQVMAARARPRSQHHLPRARKGGAR